MSNDELLASYEEVPYEAGASQYSHPDVLATSALLLGLDPTPPQTARVLELGCATGGNLLPIALAFPRSHCVGIDLSPGHVAAAQATADQLSLENVSFRAMDLMAFDPSSGPFDYIICHGVYSWVPAEVREKILSICAAHLSPQGVAYISYNTYPGWHLRGVVRDMLGFHLRRLEGPRARIEEARPFLDLMSSAIMTLDKGFGLLVSDEAKRLGQSSDTYLFHEHLERENHPVYFHEFADRCARHGLQYLAEARLSSLGLSRLSPLVQEALSRLPSELIEWEQYLDFLVSRPFRSSLLVRSDLRPNRWPSLESLDRLYVMSDARPLAAGEADTPDATQAFMTGKGNRVSTKDPATKLLLRTLSAAWPQALPFAELSRRTQSAAATAGPRPGEALSPGDAPGPAPDPLATTVLHCYLGGLVDLWLSPPRLLREVSDSPEVWVLARLQAAAGFDRIATPLHRMVTIDQWLRALLPLADGSRSEAELVDAMSGVLCGGKLTLTFDGKPVTDPAEIRRGVAESLPAMLRTLARTGLLVG